MLPLRVGDELRGLFGLAHCLSVKHWIFILDYSAMMLRIMTSNRKALLQRYDFTEQGYHERFRNAKPEGQESPGQLIVRIRNCFNKWEEISEVGKAFEGVEELMVREQFTNYIILEGAET